MWVRDAAFCVYALLRLGFSGEAELFMDFVTRHVSPGDGRASGPLQIMYGIDGRTDLTEREVPQLEQGSAPVRVGNAAAEQLQLDVDGVLDLTHGDPAGVSVIGGDPVSEAVNGRPALIVPTGSGRNASIRRVETRITVATADGASREVTGLNRRPGLIVNCGGVGNATPFSRPGRHPRQRPPPRSTTRRTASRTPSSSTTPASGATARACRSTCAPASTRSC
ncbi:hypothetical protein SGLAM104S_01778 [Streptomyces glaucescens]